MLLVSAELAATPPKLGDITAVAEYLAASGNVNKDGAAVYKYLSFNQIEEYTECMENVKNVKNMKNVTHATA